MYVLIVLVFYTVIFKMKYIRLSKMVAPVLLFVLLAGAEKKIELQDIEDDNLRSEKQTSSGGHPEARSQTDEQGALPIEFFKSGFLRYFEAPSEPHQSKYVQQYTGSDAQDRATAAPKPQYGPSPLTQQAMVSYLSNIPMQIYLVPQYYSEPSAPGSQHGQYQPNNIARVSGYPSAPEPVQPHNYVDVPTYVAPSGKSYVQQYTQPVAYVYPQPTIAPVQAPVAPVITYQMPVVQYPAAGLSQQQSKDYYQNTQYTAPSPVEEDQDNEIEDHKHYSTHTDVPYVKAEPEFPRNYNSRTPYRDEYRSGPSELPRPSPLLLKPAPPHLSHLPKALPMYRPISKPVYAAANIIQAPLTPRPIEGYGPKRRPTSLLDSYIPSSVQVEYLKRGLAKDPLVLYEALSNGRHFPPATIIPRHYERGFLPNQMYHTAAGGVTFGHHKRSSKGDKVPTK